MTEHLPDYTIEVVCTRHDPPVPITPLYHYPTWRPLGSAWAPRPQLDDPGFVRYDTIIDSFDGIVRETEPDRWLKAISNALSNLNELSGTDGYAAAMDEFDARKRSHMTLTLVCPVCSALPGASLNATIRVEHLDAICDQLRHAGAQEVSLAGIRGMLIRNG